MSTERIAPCLDRLRTQINTRYPLRNKGSDGWIGDAAHRARKSDHNPDPNGVVRALDVTHDVDKKGDDFDSWKFAEVLRLNKDPRLSYVISNGRIFYTYGNTPWQWQAYTGSNKHAQHVHVSALNNEIKYEDTRDWVIDAVPTGAVPDPKPQQAPPPGVTAAMRQRMGVLIIGYEARLDANGNVAEYIAGDGSHEIGGVNQTFHPAKYAQLKAFLDAGNHNVVRTELANFIIQYTQIVTGWVTEAGLEFYLRDCLYNRGQDGAARILQMALGFTGAKIDGEIGPASRQRIGEHTPSDLLAKLRRAREQYEDIKYGARPKLRPGLVNRWDKALADARAFSKEGGPVPVAKTTATTATVASGAVVANEAKKAGIDTGFVVAIAIIAACVGLILWKVWPRSERESLL